MECQHQGDAYDPLKRFLMEALEPLSSWRVSPMFTGAWSQECIEDYRQLVGVEFLTEKTLTVRNRAINLSSDGWHGHVFYDPTTGIKMPEAGSQGSLRHIKLEELLREISRRPHSLTLVYDQAFSRDKRLGSAEEKLNRKLAGICGDGVYGIVYNAQAPFPILSCNQDLIAQARQKLEESGIPPRRIAGPLPR